MALPARTRPDAAALLLFAFCLPAAGAAFDANGVFLGAPEALVVQRFPGAQCRPLEWKTEAASRRCDDAAVDFAGAPSRITFYLKDDAVQAFEVRFETRELERVAGHLKDRWGPPASEGREAMTVRGGRATRELYRAQWRRDGERAVLSAVLERRRASLTVSRGEFEQEIYRLR